MIMGVKTKMLKTIPDERGYLMEILCCDEDLLNQFGQVYMTTAYPGVVKGWHYHNKQDENFAVVKGMIKLVLYDRRPDSLTYGDVNEFFIGGTIAPCWFTFHMALRTGSKALASKRQSLSTR